jgi:hypothetical protein
MRGCPACPFIQAYTWTVFILLLLVSWDTVLAKIMDRMNDDTDMADANAEPVRRTYILVLVAYSVICVWFRIMLLMIFGFVGCSLISMTAHYAMSKLLEKALVWIANPAYIFDSVTTMHMPFHATVAALAVVYAFTPIVLYIRNPDLVQNKNKLRAKIVRILFGVPFFMLLVYGIYGCYCVFLTV